MGTVTDLEQTNGGPAHMSGKPSGNKPDKLREGNGLLRRLLAILRQEGGMGMYDRIRYPKPFWRRPALPSPIRGPVRIRGGEADEREQVERALRDFGIAIAPDDAPGAAEVIHLGPDWPDIAHVTDKDILAGTEPPDLDRMTALARRCRVVLTACASGISALADRGIALERIFFLKDRQRLHEGMTRCLLALQHGSAAASSWHHFSDLQNLPGRPRICVGLPETAGRRQSFLSRGLKNFILFDGIRRNPGWIGTGESFRMMAQACLDQGLDRALFTEDDVELPLDFEDRLTRIQAYLDSCDWDVFSGLITDIGPDYAVTRVVRRNGETFVHLNRCVGMVFGLYSRNALLRLASWSSASGLTIDRYLEKTGSLEVVTTLPFLAGHDDRLRSSIWRFSNRRYSRMIRGSEEKLRLMVRAHEDRQMNPKAVPGRNITKA